MVGQIIYALATIAIGVGCAFVYFWGSNWVLDRVLSTEGMDGVEAVRRDVLRTRIRPWLFLFPSLFFLGVYLVYPVIETIRLSFHDGGAREYVGLSNWIWALNSPAFLQSVINNALWLVVVPSLATAFGLLVAVLADRLWWGNIAKSLVFMPMAISFVGASVIWKFIYDYRGTSDQQIGLLNAVVMAFGGDPQAWITIPFWNNFFLMIILIWIQTGFAMVILSAALRGIPEETLEAARIDGANDVRIFFDIMVPQIIPTILVVWTTITIVVLKIFDIVLAMTGGQWDTQVLANLMYTQSFVAGHFGHGAVTALVIMVAVLPVMIWNIRQASSEEGTH